jgi:hypothetical protein
MVKRTSPSFNAIRKDIKEKLAAYMELKTLRKDFGFRYKNKVIERIDTVNLMTTSC